MENSQQRSFKHLKECSKSLIIRQIQIKSRQELKPGRNLEAGAAVDNMENCCLLA